MSQVRPVLRHLGAGLAVALLGGSAASEALAGGHLIKHGHAVTTTQVTYVPVAGYQAVGFVPHASVSMVAAPAHWQYVNSPQIQWTAPAVQAYTPATSTVMMAVPQYQYMTVGSVASTGVQGSLVSQQDLVQQFHAFGWLEKLRGALREKLAQKVKDMASTGVLPTRDQLVKFLLDEAFAFLKDTPFGPVFAILKPVIEPMIDNLIRDQSSAPVAPTVPTNGTPGAVRRYIITVQEISGDGTPIPNPGPGPLTPGTRTTITTDPQSPLETAAPFPGR